MLPFLAGATLDVLWLLLVGVLVMAIGFYMSKSQRQRNDVSWRR
ncbi:hypothetical protein ACGFR6_08120 [Streptomyces sp. NPDC048567]